MAQFRQFFTRKMKWERPTVPSPSLKQSLGGAGGSNQAFFGAADKLYMATKFIPSSSFTLTRTDWSIKKNNSPTGNITAYLYSDSSGPNTLLATSINTVNASTLTSSYVYREWDFDGYSLISGTPYWIVLYKGSFDAANYVFADGVITGENGLSKSADGTGWTSIGAAYGQVINIYGY